MKTAAEKKAIRTAYYAANRERMNELRRLRRAGLAPPPRKPRAERKTYVRAASPGPTERDTYRLETPPHELDTW